MRHTHRQNKKGGGVAVNIKNNFGLNNVIHTGKIRKVEV